MMTYPVRMPKLWTLLSRLMRKMRRMSVMAAFLRRNKTEFCSGSIRRKNKANGSFQQEDLSRLRFSRSNK
jgi:hypothetical protein